MNGMAPFLNAESRDLLSAFREVRVFGSVLTSARPSDVDVLVVYDRSCSATQVSRDVRALGESLSTAFGGVDVHITALNQEEVREARYLTRLPGIVLRSGPDSTRE